MIVAEARTDGQNYQIHIHRSVSEEILNEGVIEDAMQKCGICGELTITGWDGIHYVITTFNCPSLEQVQRLAEDIRDMPMVLV